MTGYLDRVPDPRDRCRLFCFHHAGAGASTFAGWAQALGPRIAVYPVQLPGREGRVAEPAFTDFGRLVDGVAAALAPWLTGRYALYGHSMGAALAAALARRQVLRGQPPIALLVAAYPDPRTGPPLSVAGLDDGEVIELLVRTGGMSEVLRRYPEWAGAAVRLLRADLAALHTQGPAPDHPLPIPIRAYAGSADPLVHAPAVAGWAGHTTSSFRLRTLPGGHLFHLESGAALRADIGAALGALGAERSSAPGSG
ncbi:thioesterase II family protein [Micromonospora wenchangensis]|uniref:thioesterase II family protein n=1 Tax=Micromonospora wenchangensis TaxID=1185415 RepID=UPI0013040D57|nr:alpha/beta fold hydrolase [Micromonospora wenchangensis]